MLIEQAELRTLIPHAGSMCLLNGVLHWDEHSIRCQSISHHAADNPLRCTDGLAALHGIEYAAQAMAAHGALLARTQSQKLRPGYLAAVRNTQFTCQWLHTINEPLIVTAQCLMGDANSLMYEFQISDHQHSLLSGRATVITMQEAA